MICTSLFKETVEELMVALEGVALAEVRFDKLRPTELEVKEIVSGFGKIVATNRPAGQSETFRAQILEWAITHGAEYVDLEIESPEAFKQPLIELAREVGCKVIISYHNYEHCPTIEALHDIVHSCFGQGADVAKVAVQVSTPQEAARVMSLQDTDRDVLAFGMGAAGRITRVAAPLLGAPFTYAGQTNDSITAPGQLSASALQRIYKEL